MTLYAWFLSRTVVKRMMLRALALIPALQAHVPYWNWYGFPASFTGAAVVTQLVGFLAGGLMLAKMAPNQ